MRIYPRGARGTLWIDFTVDGERVKRSAGTTDRREAEEYAATLARDLWRTKRLGEAPRITWDYAVLAWLGENQHLRSIEDIKLRLRWLTGRLIGRSLDAITDDVIRALASERKAQAINGRAMKRAESAGRSLAPKPSSNATVNRHMAELSKILHYAHGRRWLAAVPPIAKMHEPAKRVSWLQPEEARTLLGELPLHLRAMAAFSLATGLRESNVRLLCWQQVDVARRSAWIYADQAKAGRDLTVPLNDQALQVLEFQHGRHSRWVFPVPRWETVDGVAQQVSDAPTGKISNHAWRKACIRAGMPWLRFHDLRHTWASWHVQAGTPLPVLQELGGWASLAMVQRYGHLGQTHVAAWAGNCSQEAKVPTQQTTIYGTNPVQPTSQEGPKATSYLGWLMGLEPTTTGITRRSLAPDPNQIKDLRGRKGQKAA